MWAMVVWSWSTRIFGVGFTLLTLISASADVEDMDADTNTEYYPAPKSQSPIHSLNFGG
jgi:hypothetical protein